MKFQEFVKSIEAEILKVADQAVKEGAEGGEIIAVVKWDLSLQIYFDGYKPAPEEGQDCVRFSVGPKTSAWYIEGHQTLAYIKCRWSDFIRNPSREARQRSMGLATEALVAIPGHQQDVSDKITQLRSEAEARLKRADELEEMQKGFHKTLEIFNGW